MIRTEVPSAIEYIYTHKHTRSEYGADAASIAAER